MLYQQREQIKAVIYELTGLSDIARGASKASETLGAQQLKSQWGSIRLKVTVFVSVKALPSLSQPVKVIKY